MFETVGEIPAIRDRYNYLEKALSKDATTPVDIAIRVILFAELIERVSLFGLFYLIMSFNKRQNTFKGLSNIVEATTKEEEIHGAFGVEIFNILKEENPYIGESSFIEDTLKNIFIKAEKAEMKILDWVFEEGDLEHVTKEEVMNFVKLRFNEALIDMDIDFRFETDPELTEKNMWFYEELLSTKEKDFFNKRVTDYSKGTRSVSKDDLF